jgi:hypothetical protein
MGTVSNDPAAVAYVASYDLPLSITVMSTSQQWAFQQLLAYNAMLPYISMDFHGLKDFYDQMSLYSITNAFQLSGPWNAIKTIAPLNLNIQDEMYVDPDLGLIGNLYSQLPGFGKVFAVSSTDDSSDITDAASSGD